MLLVIKTIRKSKTRIDDFLIRNGFLKYATHLIPLIIARQSLPFIFTGFEKTTEELKQLFKNSDKELPRVFVKKLKRQCTKTLSFVIITTSKTKTKQKGFENDYQRNSIT